MSANVEGLIREAMNAIKAGRKEEGKTFLLKAVELDQYNEQAWLWLSGTMDSPDDQRTCLENVLAINPNNERAKQGIEYLAQQTSGGSGYAAPPPSAMISRATATSVEWDTSPATPPASPTWTQQPVAKEPTDADLDAWVSTLGLQSAAQPVKSETSGSSAPFTDLNLDVDDDMFSGGPFGAAVPPIEPAQPPPAARSTTPPTGRSVTPPAAKSTPAPSTSPAPRSPVPTDLPSFGFDDDEDDDGLTALRAAPR
ncbi:MAG: hypothetical protein IAE80_25775, partial [Anaerolinea sp.]|nr:hypothetical protein [Anaerolinea sp.]